MGSYVLYLDTILCGPSTITNYIVIHGLCVPVLLMPSSRDRSYSNNSFTPMGDYSAIFQPPGHGEVYKILDNALFQTRYSYIGCDNGRAYIGDEVGSVSVPKNNCCLAISLCHTALSSWEIPEDFTWEQLTTPCTFDIVVTNNSPIRIPKAELIYHGMTPSYIIFVVYTCLEYVPQPIFN